MFRNVKSGTERRDKKAGPFDPALFEQELESGSIPQIQKGGPSMQDYERSQQEENDVEIPYSIHGIPLLSDIERLGFFGL